MRTCPSEGDNSWKRLLIPHKPRGKRSNPLREGLMSYQLVGKVTAYQGEDG
jgi:hypothetical protein